MIERVYLNGKVVDSSEAKVTIFDGGLLHGAGLFETMRAYDGVIFRLSDHLVRLQASGEALSLFQLDDKDVEDLAEGLRELLAANELTDARVRLTMTTGDLRPGLGGGQAAGPTVFATATVMTHYPRELYENGMTVLISRYKQSRQDPTAGCKTLGYLSRLMSLREAQAQECGEALWFTHENLLSEGAISNIFIVSGKVIKTPPVDTPVLPGVTRKAVIELATDEKISIQEIPLTINDLLSADEVFLTNSIMEIMPVCRVERHAIGDERPGALTRRIADLYRKAVIKECKLDAG